MEGQFQVDRGYSATTPEGYEAEPAIETRRRGLGWLFVDEFQRMVGEDSEPDTRFFVESWTSGTAAAVENFQQRRRKPPERERPRDMFRESDSIDTVSFARGEAFHAEFSALATTNAEGSNGGRQPETPEGAVARAQEEAWQEWERLAGERNGAGATDPMTQERARLLLGVTAASTRRQIKAAYRSMVSRWHPDRLELGTEKMRRLANERMAAINEAYRVLTRELR